jgi:hypothetical protein
MQEEALLQLWNTKRMHIIAAQLGPTAVLIAVFVLAAQGTFESASSAARYLVVAVAAATGLLTFISQYAAIREGQAVAEDLGRIANPSVLATTIAASGSYLNLMRVLVTALSVAIFALVIWAVLL